MKSVFYVVGLCYMLGLIISLTTGTGFSLCFVPLLGLLAIVCVLFYKQENKTAVLTGLLCICAGILSYSISYNANVAPVQILYNQSADITATVTKISYGDNGKCFYEFETDSVIPVESEVKDCPQNIKLTISSKSDFDVEIYDIVKTNVIFSEKNNSAYTAHSISEGYYINARITDDTLEVLSQKNIPWYSFVDDIHTSVEEKLEENLSSKQTNLLMALLLGDKDKIDSTITQNFRSAGISHIIVVSGLHLSVIISFVFGTLSYIIKNRKVSSAITIVVIIFYMILTGFAYSVVRSAVMNIIYLLSYFFCKKPQALNSLGIAVLIITFVNPLAIGNLGFLMSFSATLGIVTLEERISKYIINKLFKTHRKDKLKLIYSLIEYIINCISVSLSATLFTLPVMVFVFEKFSVYFLLSNLLVTAVAPVVIVCGFIMVVLSYIPVIEFLVSILGFFEGILCDFILWVSDFVSLLPFSTIKLEDIFVKLAMVVVLLIVAFWFVVQGFRIKNLSICTAVCISATVIILSGGCLVESQSVSFTVLQTGTGATVINKSQSGVNVICCGGDNYHISEVMEYLENEKMNSLFIPDDYAYYSKYAENILDEFDVEQLLLYDTSRYSDETKELFKDKNCTYITPNTEICYDNYSVKPININNKICISVSCGDEKILIVPRNCDCSALPQEYKNNDIIILQKGCTNVDNLTADSVIMCGKDDNNGYYYTSNGDITLYKFADGGFNLWQN